MKVVALVPIKMNNVRVPGKNIKQFDDGTPLLYLMMNTLINNSDIDEVYCYCSDDNIIRFLPDKVKFFKREEKYDENDADVNDMFWTFAMSVQADIYVLAHVTAPFLKSESISKGIDAVRSSRYDSALAAKKMQEFMWVENKPMNYDFHHIPRTQDLPVVFVETTGCYIYTRDVILQEKRRIGNNPYLFLVSEIEAIDINNPQDFEIANAVYMKVIKNY